MAGLSERSRRILAGLADGHSVEQILAWDLTLRPGTREVGGDVAEAAREALALAGAPAAGNPSETGGGREKAATTVEEVRKGHARAYAPWTAEEEGRLREMVGAGMGAES